MVTHIGETGSSRNFAGAVTIRVKERLRVQAHDAGRGFHKIRPKLLLCEQHRRGGVFQHEAESIAGIRCFDWKVRTAGFEYGEKAHDLLDRTLHTDPDDHLRCDPEGLSVDEPTD